MITQGVINLLGSTPPLAQPPAAVAKQLAIFQLIAPGKQQQGTPGAAQVYLLGKVPATVQAPYLVIEQLSGEPIRSLNNGPTGEETGLVRVHCWAGDATAAQQLAQLVGELLDSFRGAAGNVTVQGIFQTDCQAQFPPPVHGDEASNPVTVKDFEIWQTGTF